MLVGTHALLPVCACLIAENLAARAGREPVLPPRNMQLLLENCRAAGLDESYFSRQSEWFTETSA